ncbi:SGNH/GDSL hydrolase family protein [Streptomyces sp. SL13]|uniref:SGNH/GDSL hydrolase family protein n=1 Tax=Streptantibioticus silvisoli TaxID=2705255 RepID=A0AA90HAQ6_9ACTN|nr:SGNH/GDSL hydrolase family protein [Streptantibioticus silvisoli]MDI5974440.1 SGNH/GDSL hydrolase family protein [Streptantibioticus silvisoli]
MRPRGPLSAIATLAFALVLAVCGTGSAQAASTGGYVALGDSYSAGNGAGDYISSSGDCHRSDSAYPALWAAAHKPSSFTFAACSGAITTDVINSQLGGLSASTALVSITIGGNDAGFSDVMTACLTDSDSSCVSRIATAESYIRDTLPSRLDSVYSAIRAKAPSARVVVLGYPDIYKLNVFCIGLSATKHQAIDQAADLLDTTTATRAHAHGFTFGDVRTTFAGHELCSGDNYLHDVALPTWESYHPTATGHSSGYLPVLTTDA